MTLRNSSVIVIFNPRDEENTIAVDLEEVRRIQQEVAKVDPSVMKLDLSNEDNVTTILLAGVMVAAMENGATVTISLQEEDDRTETLRVQPIGKGSELSVFGETFRKFPSFIIFSAY